MKKQNKDILRKKGLELMNLWRADWNRFVREALGVTLDKEQQEILSSVQYNRRTSVASGTAVEKTSWRLVPLSVSCISHLVGERTVWEKLNLLKTPRSL